ncbi:hypothetical protein QL285_045874 [Trifolium repens]|nr:hypothetical protein QL285_045874 [Trifolium repens]
MLPSFYHFLPSLLLNCFDWSHFFKAKTLLHMEGVTMCSYCSIMCINFPYSVSSNAALILPPPSIILFGKENIPFVFCLTCIGQSNC